MGELGQWLRTLVGLVLIVALFDMLLLENDFKKMARLVMGLVIMLGVLQPVLALLNSNWESWQLPSNFFQETASIDWDYRGESLRQAGIAPVLKYATNSLEAQVEQLICSDNNIVDARISTLINIKGELQQVEVVIFLNENLSLELIDKIQADVLTNVANYLQISENYISVELG